MEKVFRTYQFKLKPSESQSRTFEQWLGICRYVYNHSLAIRLEHFKVRSKITNFDLNNQLSEAKKEESLSFLRIVHSDTLQDSVERSKKPIESFFKEIKKGKVVKPKFKKKFEYSSFTFKRGVKIYDNSISLPKIGKVKYFNSRTLPKGDIKYCSIIRKIDGWYINIQVELESTPIPIDENQAVGIDVGIKVFAYLSNGKSIESNYFLEPQLRRLRILQRRLSRCIKGSKRRAKVKHQIAKLHDKIARQRKDFNHKTSSSISREFDIVCIEDLKLSNMSKLNSTLSRRLKDNAFYQFRTMLEYKSKDLIAVPPHYTSQKCSSCGETDKKSRLSQDKYVCTSCGFVSNADLNASKNILALGKSLRAKRSASAQACS